MAPQIKRLLFDLTVSITVGLSAGLAAIWLAEVLTRHMPL